MQTDPTSHPDCRAILEAVAAVSGLSHYWLTRCGSLQMDAVPLPLAGRVAPFPFVGARPVVAQTGEGQKQRIQVDTLCVSVKRDHPGSQCAESTHDLA